MVIHFTRTLGKLDENKFFQKPMDEPGINFKFLETVQKDRLDYEQNELTDRVAVPHTIHSAFKNAAGYTD